MPSELELEIWTWWGNIRRRRDTRVPTRPEICSVLLQPCLILNLLWLLLLSVGPMRAALSATVGAAWVLFLLPVVWTLVALAAGLLVPSAWWLGSPVGAYAVLGREQGFLASWDSVAMFLACVTLVGGALFRMQINCWPAVIMTAGTVFLNAVLLRCALAPATASRQWKIELPPWLRAGGGTGDDEEIGPERGAKPVYSFHTLASAESGGGQKEFQVGVLIDENTVLAPLRRINAGSGGTLYQAKPLAVVLAAGDPVNGLGMAEINRLAQQVVRAARKSGLTRYELAACILRFVQADFKYELDKDSTKRILGVEFTEYGRFPIETLADSVGDCDCTSILCAALLARCGFDCALIHVSFKDGSGHMAVGLKVTPDLFRTQILSLDDGQACIRADSGARYLYGETATDAEDPAGFGVVPLEWRGKMCIDRLTDVGAPVS